MSKILRENIYDVNFGIVEREVIVRDRLFRTEPLSWMQWAEVIGFTSLLAVSGEIIRAIHRKRKQLR